MGGYADKLQAKAAGVMEPGESILSAIRTMPSGTTMSVGIGGAVGAVVSDRQAKKAQTGQTEGSMAAEWPAMRCAVGLTDRRLVMFDYSFSGKPKDLVGQVKLSDVASVTVNKGVTNKVLFSFNDGSAAQVECAKLEKVGDFVAAFDKVKSGTT